MFTNYLIGADVLLDLVYSIHIWSWTWKPVWMKYTRYIYYFVYVTPIIFFYYLFTLLFLISHTFSSTKNIWQNVYVSLSCIPKNISIFTTKKMQIFHSYLVNTIENPYKNTDDDFLNVWNWQLDFMVSIPYLPLA